MADIRTALVTGASRGIGRAVACRLARDGFHVIAAYRSNHTEAQVTLERIRADGGSAEGCAFDITDADAAAKALDGLLQKHAIHTLVFSAGIHSDAVLVFMTPDQWKQVLDTNLYSFYTVVRPVVRQMLLARAGRVIAISSTSGETGLPGQVNYSAAKAGLIGAVKALAQECARRGVLVNAVTPGFIRTEMTEGLDIKELAARVPLNRLGTPDDVAGAVSFLASGDAAYITGQVIRVNGGIYM